ncbi:MULTISPECIES: 3-hydroxyisobutyrate dehydrogenase [Halocynthiibacter]|uniref:3-hydroxyisobutyrate dehydrogenase n=1 Tax=Halocynthiibacter halioticoli TaxID=2986804 RepID=A0AAE3LQ62_9RHOB|nr:MULTISPECIES: 3-hydroxyisobutyrate dehydrogenase [Halocynthiibacter]MCV6824142.1 3-hydroxyisobutyrate dehydrogenase [Halocynthiibacter halioticoli]MCW4057143.1 3-hydroxyisobutyrate dehydrogenase [Halocynthiibacter sp. SDUM655004]
MSLIHARKQGKIGRITLTRPKAMNALSAAMLAELSPVLRDWAEDDSVALVVIDGEGEKAFCAGGDVAEIHTWGTSGQVEKAQKFWREEYRMNAELFEYPKAIVSLMHGYVMGGGVGLGCHASHRVVCENSQISMPETVIGLIPDVGGSWLLGQAPGRLGEYLGITAGRMGPADAIFAGFADTYIPQSEWPALIEKLAETGDFNVVDTFGQTPPAGRYEPMMDDINAHFAGESMGDIVRSLRTQDTDFTSKCLDSIASKSPISMCATVELIHRQRASNLTIWKVLEQEYRFTHRAIEETDFIEGVRARLIDKDNAPVWKHESVEDVPPVLISRLLMPLGKDGFSKEEKGQTMKIGFIGLGNMGGPMATNLANAGHDVNGFDLVAPCPEKVNKAASAQDAAKDADIVITMLPNGAILKSVAEDILPVMKDGACLLDCSTVDVESARAVSEAAEKRGLLAADAPVSGGITGAAAGTLTFMVGGSEEAYKAALPLLDIMGQKSVHCGDAGAGQAAKICNNMILGVTMIATCEAFAMADKLGLDRQKMFDVVSTSSGYSWTMNAYCPAPGVGPQSPADNDYKPGFAAELMLKDLGLSQQAAESVDADTPMGKMALALYEKFVEDEDGKGMDFSAMLPRFEKRGRE